MVVASCSTQASNAWLPRAGRSTASVRSWPEPGDGSTRQSLAPRRAAEQRSMVGVHTNSPARIFTTRIARGSSLRTSRPIVRPFNEKVPDARSDRPTRRTCAHRRREASGQARLQPGPAPLVVRLLQLRDLVLDHLDPRRLLHQLRSRLQQRWAHRDLVVAGRSSRRLHPDHRLHDVRAGVGVPDVGRHLLVGRPSSVGRRRVLHRLAEPHRSDRGDRRRWPTAAPPSSTSLFSTCSATAGPRTTRLHAGLHRLRGDPGPGGAGSTSSAATCWRS